MAAVKICPLCNKGVVTGEAFLVLGGDWADGQFKANETEGVVCFDCWEDVKSGGRVPVKVEDTPLVFTV